VKNLLLIAALMLTVSQAFAQSIIEGTTAVTLSPSVTATQLMESATVTTMAPFASSITSAIDARGVAGKEQLRDDLVILNDDMVAGRISSIAEVRQPALKELFMEIAANEEQMEAITSVIEEGSELHRIATAVTVSLLLE
jgi:hypothetical protein